MPRRLALWLLLAMAALLPARAEDLVVMLRSSPSGAQVYAGARLLGETDGSVRIPSDARQLTLEMDGFYPLTWDVPDVFRQTGGGTAPTLSLQPRYGPLSYLMLAVRHHPAAIGVVALLLLLGVRRWRTRTAKEHESLVRAQQIEEAPAVEASDFLIGKTLASYRIVERLGEGGMGTVYRGTPSDGGPEVAVKVLRPGLASAEPAVRKRFSRETRLYQRLSHPGIVRLIEFGEQNETAYLVMELVRGMTLRQQLNQGPLPMETFDRLLRRILEAMAYAHSQGVVHRDLKPENVMILHDGGCKLLDLGIGYGEGFTPLTTANIPGTIAYMAPESLLENPVADAASDQYAIGVMAYEMLSGRLPFDGHPLQLLYGKMSAEVPPLQELRPEVPEALAAVVMRMLSRTPSERFPTLDAVLTELPGP